MNIERAVDEVLADAVWAALIELLRERRDILLAVQDFNGEVLPIVDGGVPRAYHDCRMRDGLALVARSAAHRERFESLGRMLGVAIPDEE